MCGSVTLSSNNICYSRGCEPVKALSGMYCYARLNRTAALSTLSTKRYVPERLHRMAVVSFENASNRYGAPKNQGARMVNTVSQSHLIVSNPVKKTFKVIDKKGQLLVKHNVVSVTPMKNYDQQVDGRVSQLSMVSKTTTTPKGDLRALLQG